MIGMENYIDEIVTRHKLSSTKPAEAVRGGEVGYVFRIVGENTPSLIIKLNRERTQEITDVDDIIYGSNPHYFETAYKILQKNNIPVPEIFATGITNDNKFNYVVMQELQADPDDYSPAWFAEVGHWFGKLHSIIKPDGTPWLQLFKQSFRSRFNTLKPLIDKNLSAQIEKYTEANLNELTPARTLCFSHLDGFQGILHKQNGAWKLAGVIDIEDHQFTDQRFVLAGFELNNKMKGNNIPQIFWDEYQKFTTIDPTYEITKNLFKVYYLMVWSYALRNDPGKFRENISLLNNSTFTSSVI